MEIELSTVLRLASVAARYAREQQQYATMHIRAIQDQERQQAIQRQKHQHPQMVVSSQNFNAVPPPEQQHLHHQQRLIIEPKGWFLHTIKLHYNIID